MKRTDILTAHAFQSCWHSGWKIFHTLEQRADLRRLVLWAQRKHLKQPLSYYQYLLIDVELRLSIQNMHYPQQYRRMRVLHGVWVLLKPRPKYYRKGAAAKYRRKNLTRDRQESYSYS